MNNSSFGSTKIDGEDFIILDVDPIKENCETEDEEEEEEENVMEKDDEETCGELDPSTFVFSSHEGSVFSLAVDLEIGMLASGGEDDKIMIWSLYSGEHLLSIEGHSDSVTHLSFSPNHKYLASGDIAGVVHVWPTNQLAASQSVQPSSHMTNQVQEELQWLFWLDHPRATILLAGAGESDGGVAVWLVADRPDQHNARYLPGVDSRASVCAALLHVEAGDVGACRLLWSVQAGGTLRCWDLRGGGGGGSTSSDGLVKTRCMDLGRFLISPRASSSMMDSGEDEVDAVVEPQPISMATHRFSNDLLAVGFSQGQILVVAPNKNQVLFQHKTNESVESMDFSDCHPHLLAFATLDGQLGIIDTQHCGLRVQWNQSAAFRQSSINTTDAPISAHRANNEAIGATRIKWFPGRPFLVSTNVDGSLGIWNGLKCDVGQMLVHRIAAHSAAILDLHVAPFSTERLLLDQTDEGAPNPPNAGDLFWLFTGSDDGTVRLNLVEL